jgi:hypothetical protein
MQNIYTDGNTIELNTFDLSCENPNKIKKLDLLFYTTINSYGEMLTSLVYNSGPKDLDDISGIVYDPNKLYSNTDYENLYIINGNSNIWRNLDIQQSDIVLVKSENSRYNKLFSRFSIESDFSVETINGNNMYDGWYTLVSYALSDNSSSTKPGTISYVGSSAMYLDNSQSWRDLTDIDSDVPIYSSIDLYDKNTVKLLDFVVTTKTVSLYRSILFKTEIGNWYDKIKYMKPTVVALEESVKNGRFDMAQHLIESVKIALNTTLI